MRPIGHGTHCVCAECHPVSTVETIAYQYGPAWVADCYGVTVDTMRGDLLAKCEGAPVTAELIRSESPDVIARSWAIEIGGPATEYGYLEAGHV